MRPRWLAAMLLLAACKAVYAPNMAAVPLLRHKGELHAAVDVRNLQAAYAAGEHVGVEANTYYRSKDETTDSGERQKGQGWLVEGGAGWFTSLRGREWLRLEIYAGAGIGHVRQEITPMGGSTRTFEADGVRAFVMPTFGFTSKYVDAAVSARLVSLRYNDSSSEGYTAQQLQDDRFAGIEDRTWLFLEPSATLRAGYKWVKAQLQVGRSFKLSSEELRYDNGMVTLGLTLDVFRTF